jgi:uncharacterized membrane protein YfcA
VPEPAASCAVSSNLVVLVLALPIGLLIGLVGIGGVLLVPLLAFAGGCSNHVAISLSLASFITLGAASVVTRVRAAGRPSRAELLLFGAMIPGAVAGALLAYRVPDSVLALLIALAVAFTGIWALRGNARPASAPMEPSALRLAAIGGFAGGASALSGTGGPLVLMPLLLGTGVAVGDALGLAKIAQFPIAVSATITRGSTTGVDLAAAVALSVVLLIGMLAGGRLAAVMPTRVLTQSIAWALLATGCGLSVLAATRIVH